MSGLRLHSRQWRFSKPSEWGKPSSGLDGEPVVRSQAALKQRRLPRDGRRIQQPEAGNGRNGASVYLCFKQGTQPLLHHNANHQGWLAPSDTRLDFMVPVIHMKNKHDMTCGGGMKSFCVWLQPCALTELDNFMRLFCKMK